MTRRCLRSPYAPDAQMATPCMPTTPRSKAAAHSVASRGDRRGILSHNRAARVRHATVDLDTVQEIRSNVRVSPRRMLHDHANLYVCGRNAMMYHVVHNNPINGVCPFDLSVPYSPRHHSSSRTARRGPRRRRVNCQQPVPAVQQQPAHPAGARHQAPRAPTSHRISPWHITRESLIQNSG